VFNARKHEPQAASLDATRVRTRVAARYWLGQSR
jgi:hypothetical protein